jgi:hypothetical protein
MYKMSIQCKLSSFTKNDRSCKKIVVIGSSNSLISHGWFFSFLENLSNFEVINLSLGACTTMYINYQLQLNRSLIENADLIVVEPIVNDISYLPNGMISENILMSAIDSMYVSLYSLNVPIITLLLPTERRTASYLKNIVYKKHIQKIEEIGSYLIDLHPLFSAVKNKFSSLFLNPGHIDLNLASHLGHLLSTLIEKTLQIEKVQNDANLTLAARYEIIDAKKLGLTNIASKDSNMFEADVAVLKEQLQVNVPKNKRLVGITHWNKVNDVCIMIKNQEDNEIFPFKLKGKYLKLSSPSVDLTGPLVLEPSHISGEVLIESIMLENVGVVNEVQVNSRKIESVQKEFNISIELMFYKFLHLYFDCNIEPVCTENWLKSRDSYSDYVNYKNFLVSISRAGLSDTNISERIEGIDKEILNYWGNA